MLTIKQFTFNPIQENTYVIYHEKGECCIVDPGCYFSNERNELKNFIAEHNLRPKYLLNTHCHLDHIFGNKFVADQYGLTLHFHSQEKLVFDNAPASGLMFGLPFEQYKGAIVYIDEGSIISLAEENLEVLFTPGHSPGSVSFYSASQGFVVGGDVLFNMGVGRTDLPGGNFDTLVNSIRTKLFVLPPSVVVYSGHGPQTTVGYEKLHNPFLQ